MEFFVILGDWVYYDCFVYYVFSEDDCICVLIGMFMYFIENLYLNVKKKISVIENNLKIL